MLDQTTIIDLIRHGEPVGGSKYRGQVDDPLSDKGWRQMREAVGDHKPWQAIVSSPLSRCAEFARELAQRHALPLSFDDRFKEIGFGDWEGCTKEQITASDPKALFHFYNDPIANPPPGAETLMQFRGRIDAAWQSLIEQYAGQHVLLVGHAGVIRMVLRHVLEMPLERIFRINVPNAAISRIRIDGVGQDALTSLMFHVGRL
jgi:alpha-ribazole phosphatase/probable phosphoglycerate mutase